LILTVKFHYLYVKASESGVGVGNFGKAGVGVGVGYFTFDSATKLATPPNLIYTKRMQSLRMLPDRPDKKSAVGRPTLQTGHFLYACITPEVHLSYPGKINLSRVRDMCKFESSQNDESRAQSADFSKAYRKPRAFH